MSFTTKQNTAVPLVFGLFNPFLIQMKKKKEKKTHQNQNPRHFNRLIPKISVLQICSTLPSPGHLEHCVHEQLWTGAPGLAVTTKALMDQARIWKGGKGHDDCLYLMECFKTPWAMYQSVCFWILFLASRGIGSCLTANGTLLSV